MDQSDHLLPQIHIEYHSNIILCLEFYLKANLHHTEPFRKKSGGSHVSSMLFGSNRQHMPVCAKMISFYVTLQLHILLQLYAYIIMQLHIIHQRPRIMIVYHMISEVIQDNLVCIIRFHGVDIPIVFQWGHQ